jgi:hypothetical protein
MVCHTCALLSIVLRSHVTSHHRRQAQQYPMMDKVADKIILKYQQSTCEQLWVKKSEKAPPSAEEQKAVASLKSDPQTAR